MAVVIDQGVLYAITAVGAALTIWFVIPRPWRRKSRV
jgi:hypothetical protein